MMPRLLLTLSALALILPCARASLYAPAPPKNAAFLRVLNLQTGSSALIPTLGGEALSRVGFRQASAYLVTQRGRATLNFGPGLGTVNVQAGKFYTAVLQNGKVQVLSDPTNPNRSKVLINFYNFAGGPLSLKTADGKLEVIGATAPSKVGSRAVNPLKTTFALFQGGKAAATLPPVTLERGGGYSVVAFRNAGKLEALLIRNTTEG